MRQVFIILSMEQFLLMAETLLPWMEWLEGEPSRTAMTVGPGQLEPETVDFEINGIPPEDVERVEEEVLKSLDGLSLDFECIGSSDSGGNVALRGPSEEAKAVSRVIRRILKAILDGEHHAGIEIECLGPGDDDRKVFGLDGKVIPDA